MRKRAEVGRQSRSVLRRWKGEPGRTLTRPSLCYLLVRITPDEEANEFQGGCVGALDGLLWTS